MLVQGLPCAKADATVALDNLKKQLRRELKANPKKAGMLALLAAVAIWFWLPLILPSGDDQQQVVAAPAPATTAAPPSTAQPSAPAEPAWNWQELAKWIDLDPRMLSGDVATLAHTDRNPFGPSKQELDRRAKLKQQQDEAKAKEETAQTAAVEPTPQSEGLTLSSTLVGKRQRLAMIDGEVYAEGAMVESKNGKMFLLKQITPDGVVVQFNGKSYDMLLDVDKDDNLVSIRPTPAAN